MNKKISLTILMCLLAVPAYAQMGGGMMGGRMGGMMGGGRMGNRGYSNQRQGPEGAQIYGMYCSSCHGQGGNTIYPNLPLRGAPQLSDFNSFLNFIRNPRMPDGSSGPMPTFPSDSLTNPQAEVLYNYLIAWLGRPRAQRGAGPVNEDQAKQEVEGYMKSTGNPNLKLGKIEDKGKDWELEIVTKDGSLVDKILVNKSSGTMRSIY
jgi:mono/diheme cytochrome c family protein